MIQLTKPVLVALAAGIIAVCSIAVAAWRLSSVSEAPPSTVERPVAPAPGATPGDPRQSSESTVAPAGSGAAGGGSVPVAGLNAGAASPLAGAPNLPVATPGQSREGAASSSAAPSAGATAPASPAPTPAPSGPKPSFDVVRIDPTGDAVVAGRAAPRAEVALMLSGKPVARAQADADGQFVMLPPSLPPGDHVLALRATGSDGETISEQSVSIAVPERGGQQAVAALAAPNKPTVVLSQPGNAAGAAGVELRIASVEALQGGAMFASGSAPPGASLRLYLNEAFVAAVEAGADGKWSIRVERGMSAGPYRVRADRVGADGRATSRVEAPFDYPVELARQVAQTGAPASGASAQPAAGKAAAVEQQAKTGQATAMAPGQAARSSGAGDAQNAVVPEVRTARVTRGDSLWRISTTIYGEGTRYTQIYDANAAQIRDPDLIYPGQILVVPEQNPPRPAQGERRR